MPMTPTIIRITPTVPTLIPLMCLVTANFRIAPIAMRVRLPPMPMTSPALHWPACPLVRTPVTPGSDHSRTPLDRGGVSDRRPPDLSCEHPLPETHREQFAPGGLTST